MPLNENKRSNLVENQGFLLLEPANSSFQLDIHVNKSITLLPPTDVFEVLSSLKVNVNTVILDPWYNKGFGGVNPNYYEWIEKLINLSCNISDHVFLWGFPEIIYKAVDFIPKGFHLQAWLTWFYKNCPSVIRGWRSSQNTCLHISKKSAKLYPENFLNEAQLQKQKEGKLRYIPGPPNVIEEPLLVGFVGKKEQTGHPAQKPVKVFETLIKMTTKENDTVLDPMCGSGTAGAACLNLNRNCILNDYSVDYLELVKNRLNINIISKKECKSYIK